MQYRQRVSPTLFSILVVLQIPSCDLTGTNLPSLLGSKLSSNASDWHSHVIDIAHQAAGESREAYQLTPLTQSSLESAIQLTGLTPDQLLHALNSTGQIFSNALGTAPLPQNQPSQLPQFQTGSIRALCSGLFVSPGYLLTARHCLQRNDKEGRTYEEHSFIRQYRWSLDANGMIEATGYLDVRLTDIVYTQGDLVLVSIQTEPGSDRPHMHPIATEKKLENPSGQNLVSLGYPSDSVAAPVFSTGTITDAGAATQDEQAIASERLYRSTAPMLGGMSGGPQFIMDGSSLVPIGINSWTSGKESISPLVNFARIIGQLHPTPK